MIEGFKMKQSFILVFDVVNQQPNSNKNEPRFFNKLQKEIKYDVCELRYRKQF